MTQIQPEYLTNEIPTPEEYEHLYGKYGLGVNSVMEKLFESEESEKGILWNLRGTSGESIKHGYDHEWVGNPKKGTLGISQMSMREVQNDYFLNQRGLNPIERNNRKEFLNLINDLKTTDRPLPSETSLKYLVRVMAIRNGGGQILLQPDI